MQCPDPGHFYSSLTVCVFWLLDFGIDTWLRLRYSRPKSLLFVHFFLLVGAGGIVGLSHFPLHGSGYPVESAASALGFCLVGVRLALRTTTTRQTCDEIDSASRKMTFSPWMGFVAALFALVILKDSEPGAPSGTIVALVLPLVELISAIERIHGTDRTRITRDEMAKWRLAVLDGWMYGITSFVRFAYAVFIALLGQDTRRCVSPIAVTVIFAIEALHSILRLAFSLPCFRSIRQNTPDPDPIQDGHVREVTESLQALRQSRYSCFLKPCSTVHFNQKLREKHERGHLMFRRREFSLNNLCPTDSYVYEQYSELILREIVPKEESQRALAMMLLDQNHIDIIDAWFDNFEACSVYETEFGSVLKQFMDNCLPSLTTSWNHGAQALLDCIYSDRAIALAFESTRGGKEA